MPAVAQKIVRSTCRCLVNPRTPPTVYIAIVQTTEAVDLLWAGMSCITLGQTYVARACSLPKLNCLVFPSFLVKDVYGLCPRGLLLLFM